MKHYPIEHEGAISNPLLYRGEHLLHRPRYRGQFENTFYRDIPLRCRLIWGCARPEITRDREDKGEKVAREGGGNWPVK